MNKSINRITYNKAIQDTIALANKVKALNLDIQAIVIVTCGGLIPGYFLAKYLNINNIDTISISSYVDSKEGGMQENIKLYKDISPSIIDNIEHDKILVFDELVDTGGTFKYIQSILPNAYYASLYVKKHGLDSVNIYSEQVNSIDWLLFEWEEELSKY